MKSLIKAVAIALSVLSTAAFFGGISSAQAAWLIETNHYVEETYTNHDFAYVAGGRDLRVEVRGNVAGLSQHELAHIVTSAMNAAHPGYLPRTHYIAQDSERARDSYRVVMIFGAKGVIARTACGDPESLPVAHSGGRPVLTAVFCWRDERINSVQVRPLGQDSGAAVTIAAMVANSMRAIFPNKFRISP